LASKWQFYQLFKKISSMMMSVCEEEAKIKNRHNLNLLVAVTIYCEELNRSMHHHKRMKKECWGGGGTGAMHPSSAANHPGWSSYELFL
jgi:hypothetical protein